MIKKTIIALQLILILTFGILTIIKFPIWSPIDEGAHFNYIQIINEKKRLPILGKDFTSNEVFSIAEKIYPKRSSIEPEKFNPEEHNLSIQSYEAFQPPLYYLITSPIYSISDNHINKIFWLRSFDFIIYLSSIFLSFVLINLIFTKGKSINAKIFVLNFFLLPGLIVRNVTISNSVLEIPLVLLFLIFIYKHNKKEKVIFLYLQGLIMGLMILTKNTLAYMAPVWLLYLLIFFKKSNFSKKVFLHCLLTGVLSLMISSPWFIFNIKNYGSLTSNKLATEMQKYVVNPNNTDYKISELYKYNNYFVNTILIPEEWNFHYNLNSIFQFPKEFIKNIFFILPLLLIPISMTTIKKHYLLITPFIFNLLVQNFIIVTCNWPVYLGRYLYGSLIPYTLFIFVLFTEFTKSNKKNKIIYLSIIITITCIIWWYLVSKWYLL